MNRKQKIIVSITGIFLVLMILVGLTNGYFLTKITDNTNEKSVSISTANLQIKYSDNSDEILGKDLILEPSNNAIDTKDFTVTNEGNSKTSYVVIIEDVKITNLDDGTTTTFNSNDFKYTLTCIKKDGTKCNSVEKEIMLPLKKQILVGNSIDVDDVQTYTLTLWYIDTGIDQSKDMNKRVEAKINITDIVQVENQYLDNKNSLAYNVIENAKNKTNGTELLASPLTQVAEEKITETTKESTLSVIPDDYGISYYFRGKAIDNYVDFAGMCWKIIRIEGDGSIKLLLDDQDNLCSSSTSNYSIPVETGGEKVLVGIGNIPNATGTMTASDGSTNEKNVYVANYLNPGGTIDRYKNTLVYAFENFQTTKLNDYIKYLKSGGWCYNDKAYVSTSDNSNSLNEQEKNDKYVKTETFYYDYYVRLNGKTIKEPRMSCNGTIFEKYGDNITDMYVATLTADEVAYAGLSYGSARTGISYVIFTKDATNDTFLLLSLNRFTNRQDNNFTANNKGYMGSSASGYARPSIQLKNNVEITNGDGTKDNAYQIKVD